MVWQTLGSRTAKEQNRTEQSAMPVQFYTAAVDSIIIVMIRRYSVSTEVSIATLASVP